MAVEDIVGNRCRRSFLLPVHTGHIACMGCGGHCMFQGIFQVSVQYSLPCCCGDIAAGYIGRIYFLTMGSRLMTMLTKPQTGPSEPGGSFHIDMQRLENYRHKGKKGIYRLADPMELPGKISDRFLSDGKVGPCGSGKNHPRCAPVFFPETLPFRNRPLLCPCSSTGCQARIFNNQNKMK